MGAASCAAAVPTVTELEVTGAVRFVAPEGEAVSSAGDGLPVLVTAPGRLCAGDVGGRSAIGRGSDRIEEIPAAELSLDCVDFSAQAVFARWSPDGTRVAVMGAAEGAESDIWIYDTVGGAVTNVSGDAGEDTLPFWVDDRTVVFVRNLEGLSGPETSWQIVSVDSGVPRKLASVAGGIGLDAGARVVKGDPGGLLFSLWSSDGETAAIHRLDPASGVVAAVWAPEGEQAADGFRLLDVHPDGTLALVVLGGGGLDAGAVDVRLVDLLTGTERSIEPLFRTSLGDVRFSGDGTRLFVWEEGTDQEDALVVRSTGSDEDAEILLTGELGPLAVVERGVTLGVGRDLVLVRIEP